MFTEQKPNVEVDVISAEERERRLGAPDLPPQFNEITSTGNCAGLGWLAGRILSLAEADAGTHIHLNRGAHTPIYASPADWSLTIALDDNAEEETL